MMDDTEQIKRVHVDKTCVQCGETIKGAQYSTDKGVVCGECNEKTE